MSRRHGAGATALLPCCCQCLLRPLMRRAQRLAWEGVALGHHHAVSVAPPQSLRAVFSGRTGARLGGHVNQADVDRPKEVGDGDQAAYLIRVGVGDGLELGLGLGLLNLAIANDQGARQPFILFGRQPGDSVELELVGGELLADIVPCLEHRPEIQAQAQACRCRHRYRHR